MFCYTEDTRVIPIPPSQGFLCTDNLKWVVRKFLEEKCLDTLKPPDVLTYFTEEDKEEIKKQLDIVVGEMSNGSDEWDYIEEEGGEEEIHNESDSSSTDLKEGDQVLTKKPEKYGGQINTIQDGFAFVEIKVPLEDLELGPVKKSKV